MKKIGIVGGVAWPSTADYYRLICSHANAHFKDLGVEPPYPTPPITIESLVMHETRKLRGKPGDGEEGWVEFDAAFRDAFKRLEQAGCDFGLIASNTPHARLHAIREGLDLPIISILEETARATKDMGVEKAIILGTSVTMRGDGYPKILREHDIEPCPKLPDDLIDEMQRVIDTEFYEGASDAGRGHLLGLCEEHVKDRDSTAVLLACTELPLAFPRNSDNSHFDADGFRFVNTTAAHALAALNMSLGLSDEAVPA